MGLERASNFFLFLVIKTFQMKSQFQFNSHTFFCHSTKSSFEWDEPVAFFSTNIAKNENEWKTKYSVHVSRVKQQPWNCQSFEKRKKKYQIKVLTICFAFGDWFRHYVFYLFVLLLWLMLLLCDPNHWKTVSKTCTQKPVAWRQKIKENTESIVPSLMVKRKNKKQNKGVVIHTMNS